jgi:phosphoribosylformylglycinamidine synthase
MDKQWVASAHGIYRGGLAIHLALKAMGGDLGLKIDLGQVPVKDVDRDDTLLFSESAGRLMVTVDPKNRSAFEALFSDLPCACIGQVTEAPELVIKGIDQQTILSVSVKEIKASWKRPFGNLK